jgi:CubicO group peptidase (beta-lactamase class C family)
MPQPKAFPVLIVALLLSLSSISATQRSPAPQSTNGFAADRLARIDRILQQHVDENRIAGAVGLVLRDGKPVYERAFGWSDKESQRRMTVDTIFRIASQ